MTDVSQGQQGGQQGSQGSQQQGGSQQGGQQQQAPWHAGVEPETIGFWQNKGIDLADPKAFAIKLTEQYRNAEKLIGAPPDQLLKMPKADAKPEDIKAFWQRLGTPGDPKDYDLSSIKFAGADLEQGFADSMRAALSAAYVPKDKAGPIVAAVVKYLESADAAESAVNTAKLAEEKTKLAADWKNNFDFNHLKAMEGARRLGISPEAVAAMEKQIGYAAVMEAMRKIGAGTSEDTFVDRGITSGGAPTTREGAVARKSELMADKDWAGRYLKGSAAERREMDALNFMIDGESR